MPDWMLDCRECKKAFVHSRVTVVPGQYEPWAREPKPEFPIGGSILECPNCKIVPVYQSYELTYSAQPDAGSRFIFR